MLIFLAFSVESAAQKYNELGVTTGAIYAQKWLVK